MELLGPVLVAVALLVAAWLMARRPVLPPVDPVLESVAEGQMRLQSELARMARAQEELRSDVQRGREASLLQVAETTQGLRTEIAQAQRALAEVKALEQGRARQMDQAADSLKRLEAVVAGSGTRGAAGENILARALGQLPPDLLEVNLAFGNKVVEYALRLPGGRVLPIDSKWTSVASLERLGDAPPPERRKLVEQIVRDVRLRVRDMAKYLDPERTFSLALLAVPDAVYEAAPEAHAEGHRAGVIVVPYSLALPYVLAVYRLTIRFGCAVDTDRLAERLRGLEQSLRTIDEEVEGRLSRGLVQVENAREALRDHVADMRRATHKLLQVAEETEPVPAATGRRSPDTPLLAEPVAVASPGLAAASALADTFGPRQITLIDAPRPRG